MICLDGTGEDERLVITISPFLFLFLGLGFCLFVHLFVGWLAKQMTTKIRNATNKYET